MKKTKHTEEQIIGVVKQMEAGQAVRDLAQAMGVTDQTLYNWRSKYGGMEVSEGKRLKSLEDENRRLKEIVADLSLDKEALKAVISKKRVELVSARRDVVLVMNEYKFSERRACRLLNLDRATYRYDSRPDHNDKLREELVELARQNPRFGYRRLWILLTRRKGWKVETKRVHRLYKEEGLAVRRLRKKRIVRATPAESLITAPNQEWALDFVHDTVASGRSRRALTLVDVFTQECPAIEAGSGLCSWRVTRVLDRVIEVRLRPRSLRCDNGAGVDISQVPLRGHLKRPIRAGARTLRTACANRPSVV
jgi:putative transposase